MNLKNIFIIILMLFSFTLPLVEARTADEWIAEGIVLGQLRMYPEAIKAYDEALKINPQFAEAWQEKGIALAALGRNDEANRAFDEALKIDPNYSIALYNKGNALKSLGRNDEANRAFDEALKNDPQIAAKFGKNYEANNSSNEAPKLQKSPGFVVISAIADFVIIAHLLRKKG